MRSWVIGACEYDVLTRSWCLRKRMTQLEMVFAHTYEVSEFPELPGSGWGKTPVHYFPRTQTRPEHDGIWIKVVPSTGLPWVGVFDFGYGVPPAISAILSAPNPGVLCVVSAGAGYLVKSDEPDAWIYFRSRECAPFPSANSSSSRHFTSSPRSARMGSRGRAHVFVGTNCALREQILSTSKALDTTRRVRRPRCLFP
jgi:hypothetical protein